MDNISDFSKSETIIIKSKDYGNITACISEKNKIGSNYYVMFQKNNKTISGLIDKNGNEIIPFTNMILEQYFTANHDNDICLAFKIDEIEDLIYYHLQKKDGKHVVVRSTDPYIETPIAMIRIKEYPDYWLLRKTAEDIESFEYAIYDPKLKTTISSFFNELSFKIDENPYGHFVYFSKYIYSTINDEETDEIEVLNHTSLCGFMDINGNFSTQLLDIETNQLYNSYFAGINSISNEYYNFIYNLTQKHLNMHHDKENEIDMTLKYLFNHNNLSEKPKTKTNNKKAKILDFKPNNQ